MTNKLISIFFLAVLSSCINTGSIRENKSMDLYGRITNGKKTIITLCPKGGQHIHDQFEAYYLIISNLDSVPKNIKIDSKDNIA